MSGPSPTRLAAAEDALARRYPGFLDEVRLAASRLAVADPDADDTRAALDAVDRFADMDLEPPTASRFPLIGLVKVVTKRLIRWYLGYFGRQMTTFGQAVVNLADILVERDEEREAAITEIRAEIVRLGQRIDRLEQADRSSR